MRTLGNKSPIDLLREKLAAAERPWHRLRFADDWYRRQIAVLYTAFFFPSQNLGHIYLHRRAITGKNIVFP